METEHLKEFLVMSKTLNYTSASDELFISQSSLFKHIKALESELGVSLFERDGKSISMTDYGKMFVQHAEVMLHEIQNYSVEVDNHREAKANILTIIDEYPNPELLFGFRKAYPHYSVKQQFMNTVNNILESDCELFVLRGELPELSEIMDYREITADSVNLITSLDHPLAKNTSVKLSDLKNESFIGFSIRGDYMGDGSRLETMHDVASLCRGAGFEPDIIMTAFPGSEIARLVSEGGGVSLLFRNSIMRRMGNQIAYIPLDPEMNFPVRIYYRKDKPLSKVAQSYINFSISWYESYK